METLYKPGVHIRKWRTLRGVKQKDLAAALGIGESTMSNLENNLSGVTLMQLETVSAYLNVPIPDLFTDPTESLGQKIHQPTGQQATGLVAEQELIYAVIRSLEKKDQQLEAIVQDVLRVMTNLVKADR